MMSEEKKITADDMTLEEIKEAASKLGYEVRPKQFQTRCDHQEGMPRWVQTSELGTVKIEGDGEAYITLVDDALDEFEKENLRGYTVVLYSRVRMIPRLAEAVEARRAILRIKDRCRQRFGAMTLAERFPDIFSRECIPTPPELSMVPKDGYTKEYVSHVLDEINRKNGLDWRFVK